MFYLLIITNHNNFHIIPKHQRTKADVYNFHKQGLNDWLIEWLTDWTIEWLNDWMIEWLYDCMIEWLTDWTIEWLNDCMIEWLNDWLIEWLNDWLIEWLNDSHWVVEVLKLFLIFTTEYFIIFRHFSFCTRLNSDWGKECSTIIYFSLASLIS